MLFIFLHEYKSKRNHIWVFGKRCELNSPTIHNINRTTRFTGSKSSHHILRCQVSQIRVQLPCNSTHTMQKWNACNYGKSNRIQCSLNWWVGHIREVGVWTMVCSSSSALSAIVPWYFKLANNNSTNIADILCMSGNGNKLGADSVNRV